VVMQLTFSSRNTSKIVFFGSRVTNQNIIFIQIWTVVCTVTINSRHDRRAKALCGKSRLTWLRMCNKIKIRQ